jgi:hypothetical protein
MTPEKSPSAQRHSERTMVWVLIVSFMLNGARNTGMPEAEASSSFCSQARSISVAQRCVDQELSADLPGRSLGAPASPRVSASTEDCVSESPL